MNKKPEIERVGVTSDGRKIEYIKNPQLVGLPGGGTHMDIAIITEPNGTQTIIHQRRLPTHK